MDSSDFHWIESLATALDERLRSAQVESAISGPGWVSVRTDRGFLWLWIVRGLRLVWLAERPVPRRWLDLLGRHARSPFAPHLRGGRVATVRALADDSGSVDGLAVEIQPGGRRLCVRFFPRPGALWVEGPDGTELARSGRMEGARLEPMASAAPPVDLATHAASCEARVAEDLLAHTTRRVEQQVTQGQKRLQRRLWTLEGDLERARRGLADRGRADLLAAHLHELRPGQESVTLPGFDGEPVAIELDPALPPHANLDRWYRRAAKAERSVEQIEQRLQDTRARMAEVAARLEGLQALGADDLDAWLDFAETHDLAVTPRDTTATAQKRQAEERLPWWAYRWKDWEIRVGRSASDNDELTLRHSHLRDLWLHAQGVGGSHVVIHSAGRHVPKDVIEDAARIAAWYSKARTSSVVAVHVVERRYVRKPRKAPPGTVKLDRAETLFVEPGIPGRWIQD